MLGCLYAPCTPGLRLTSLHLPTWHETTGPCNTVNICPKGKGFLRLERLQGRRCSHPNHCPLYSGFAVCLRGEQITCLSRQGDCSVYKQAGDENGHNHHQHNTGAREAFGGLPSTTVLAEKRNTVSFSRDI